MTWTYYMMGCSLCGWRRKEERLQCFWNKSLIVLLINVLLSSVGEKKMSSHPCLDTHTHTHIYCVCVCVCLSYLPWCVWQLGFWVMCQQQLSGHLLYTLFRIVSPKWLNLKTLILWYSVLTYDCHVTSTIARCRIFIIIVIFFFLFIRYTRAPGMSENVCTYVVNTAENDVRKWCEGRTRDVYTDLYSFRVSLQTRSFLQFYLKKKKWLHKNSVSKLPF